MKKTQKLLVAIIIIIFTMNICKINSYAASFSISDTGFNLLKEFEGCRLTAYKASANETYWTIGYGHYGADVYQGMQINQSQAEALFKKDIAIRERYVNNFLTNNCINVSQLQFDTLVSLTYNIGQAWMSTSSNMVRTILVNGQQNYSDEDIKNAFLKHIYSQGIVLPGLVNRRNREASLFIQGRVDGPRVHNAEGHVDGAEGGEESIHVRGWVLDRDNVNASTQVHVYIGGPAGSGHPGEAIVANAYRADVNNAYPGVGNYHGFDATISSHGYLGKQNLWFYAINADGTGGKNTFLGTKEVNISPKQNICGTPNISYKDVTGGKTVEITAGSADTIYYTIKKDNQDYTSGTANGSFSTTLSVVGKYSVTAYAARGGYLDSSATTKNADISTAAAPEINQTVSGTCIMLNMISKTSGAAIYYTMSGNTPTVSSTKYAGPVSVNTEKTIKAIAVKSGYVNSEISESRVKLTIPDAPTGLKMSNEDKIAVGENVSVSWEALTAAASYTVSLHKDGKEVSSTTISGTSTSLNLPTAGKYQIKIYSSNFVGNSLESDTILNVEAMNPLNVKFVDWDESVIETQEVPYGKDATIPDEPSRRGHTFISWINADKVSGVKEDLVVTANYKINTYIIQFVDAAGKSVGASQRVEFGKAADSPEDKLTDIPTGYIFAGWKVVQSSNDSLCNYLEVDSDMKLQAVYYWENEDIPILNEITRATWDSKTGNYTVNVKLTNYPTNYTTALLRVSLYTKQGKMVKSTKTEFDISADGSSEKEITLKYSGTATVAKACVLGINGDDLTSSALSKEISKNVTCLTDTVWSDWTDWTETEQTADAGKEVEKKTQYRYADKVTTTSSASSMAGWTQYDITTNYSGWGGWSAWTRDPIGGSDTRLVETSTVYGYYYYRCPNCGSHSHGWGTNACYTWAGGCGASIPSTNAVLVFDPVSWNNAGLYEFKGTGKYATDSLGGGRWFKWNDGTGPWTGYRYCDRSKSTTYSYYRWGDWSAWGETAYSANDNKKVETRTLYRTRTEVPVYDDLTGTEEPGTPITISGALKFKDPDLSGKLATVMVYKGRNIDPNEDQIQYIGQTTIGEGNTYSFVIITKEDPTVLSGDYTICLGIEGSTGLINVDMLEAPKQEYTVTYVDDNGTEISTQTVKEGNNAIVPESPKKAGHQFVGWSSNAVNVIENMTIVAAYTPIQYVVVFVDSKNNVTNSDNYYYGYYGDKIVFPSDPSAEGCTFLGWDCALNNKDIIEGNMIVNAVYKENTYKVTFVDEKEEVINTQDVVYGHAAVLPAALDVEGKEFLGWSTDIEWWNVKEDMTVKPILVYLETVDAPTYSLDQYEDRFVIYLDTSTENADIYYTLDGSTPDMESIKYEDPIVVDYYAVTLDEESNPIEKVYEAKVNAVAVAEEKNDSEIVPVVYSKTIEIDEKEGKDLQVTLDVNGGNALENNIMTVTYNFMYGNLPETTRDGYVFDGWYTAQTDGEQVGTTDICTEDIILYAHWTKKTIEDPCANGHTEEIRNAKPATTTEEGYTGNTYCSVCGTLIKEGTVIPIIQINENVPTVSVGTVKGQVGKEVTIPVMITKNSGIAGFSFDVNYDSTKLTLKSITAGEVLTTGSVSTNLNVVNWYTTDNLAVDGTVLNLTFEIAADAAAGQIPVSVALHDGKKNLVDENGAYVEANYQAGYVEAVKGLLGDMNGDDDLTIADVVLLNKHVLNKATLDAEHLALADVNKDGDITIGDVVLLNRCVLGKISLQADAKSMKDEVIHSRALTAMSVTADDITVNPGEKISVPIRVKGNTGFAGLAFSINVPQGYTLNSITAGEMLAAGTFSTNENNCTWYTTDNISIDGLLMTLNLTAAADAKTAKISVTVKDGKANNLADENGMTVPAEFTAGTITVDTQTECEKNGHKEVKDEAVAATCTEAGKTEGSHCSVCNEVIKAQEEVPALGHDWDEGTVTTPASCSEEGVKTYTCSRCSETKTEVITKIAHTEVKDEAVAATCTEAGKTEGSHCSVCNEVIKAQEEIPALGHDWDEGTVTTPATCTEEGSMAYSCSRCDETKTEVIPAEGHKWSDWKVTKAATYDQAGSKERICSVCNEKETEVIPKLVRTSITKASVSGITSKAYTGKAQTQSSLVIKVAGNTLKNGTDYSVAYKNNTNLGKATLMITGKGNYTGSLTKTFNINVIKGQTYVVNGMKYQMTNTATNGSGTVTLTGTILGKDKVKTLTVAASIKIGNKYFNITAIGNGAFKNYTKLTKLTIGTKIKTIGKDSFSGCKVLKNIDIKTKKLTSIGKNAFKNINKKAKLKVPSGKKNAYMKMLKKSTNIKI